MEQQNNTIEKRVRYSFQICTGKSWSTLMTNGTIAYCYDRTRARAYLPTILANVECDGVRVVEETYWVKA